MWLRLALRYHFTIVPKVQILYRKYKQLFSLSDQVEQRAWAFHEVFR